MNSISNIAGSAVRAFSASQQVSAHNVANLNNDDFKASGATFQENRSGGVNAVVSGTQDTVEISRKAVSLLSNTAGFKANLNVLKAADEMTRELFSIKA